MNTAKTILITLITLSACFNASNAFAMHAEDLYPCNLEIMRPPVGPDNKDKGNFYARAYVEDQTQDLASPMRFRWLDLTAPKNGAWISLFSPVDEFKYKVQSIEFPQSVELTGTTYRIGFCYAGPTAAIAADNTTDTSQGSYGFVGTLNLGTLAEDVTYQGSVTGSCDLRSVGFYKNARGNAEIFPGSIESDTSWSINLGTLTSGEISFNQMINTQTAAAPRFCKMNIEVNETSNSSRPWSVNAAQPQITLQIDKDLF